jgi:hypothetical protein
VAMIDQWSNCEVVLSRLQAVRKDPDGDHSAVIVIDAGVKSGLALRHEAKGERLFFSHTTFPFEVGRRKWIEVCQSV